MARMASDRAATAAGAERQEEDRAFDVVPLDDIAPAVSEPAGPNAAPECPSTPPRQRWNSRLQFVFTCIGYAVGIGNLWRFPYLAYRFGGGAFLIPYLLMLTVLGIPLFVLELCLGQTFQTSTIGVYAILGKRFRGIGYANIVTVFVIGAYYTILLAWSLMFFIYSFAPVLPWGTDSQSFFDRTILNKSESVDDAGAPQWYLVLAVLLSVTLTFLSVRHGVSSSGRASVVLVTVPYVLLAVLFVRGVTLDGAGTGIAYYLTPDWSRLLNIEIWVQAASQIFFSLGPAQGLVIAFGSYLPRKENVVRDALIISIVNSATSIFAGFVVFSVLGHFSLISGVPIDRVATEGPGLAFVVYPDALSLLPAAPVFSVAFFLMLFGLGVSSLVAMHVGIVSIVHEQMLLMATRYPRLRGLKKTHVALVLSPLSIIGTLPFTTRAGVYLLNLFDHFVPQFVLLLVGLLECVAMAWAYGTERFRAEMQRTTGRTFGRVWAVAWKWVVPVLIVLLLIMEAIEESTSPFSHMPPWALGLGWTASIVSVLPMVPFMLWPLPTRAALQRAWKRIVHTKLVDEPPPAQTGRHERLSSEAG